MKFFNPDLYRRLAIGFVIGTALVVAANAETWAGEIAPPAQAASNLRAGHDLVPPAPEFLIGEAPSKEAP
ncbi:MAG: hypothetical protein V2I27_04255 [Erythrobacter sp.]|jgi:hypothetical protein|nr:hypothetical protein [Erythrobacter sp.]